VAIEEQSTANSKPALLDSKSTFNDRRTSNDHAGRPEKNGEIISAVAADLKKYRRLKLLAPLRR
jgi:hypothetical protein